jgi:glycosyltransferase involved in cell wall biosynthesis
MEKITNKPLFSIVIPTYNHASYIGKALNSIINQSYKDWEVIVVNNFSVDNTIEIVEQFKDSRIKLVNFRNNGIIGASRNRGIILATGKWICFLDSDDFWYPNKLEATLQFLPRYDIIYHNLDIYDLDYKIKGILRTRSLKKRNTYKDLFFNGNALANSGVIVKRELIEKAGGFSEDKDIMTVEDYDLWLKISLISSSFYCINTSLGGYLVTGQNMSSNVLKTIEKEANLIEKHKSCFNTHDFEKLKYRYYYFWGRRHYLSLKDNNKALEYFMKSKNSNDFKSKIKSIINIWIIFSLRIIKNRKSI